MTRFKVAVVQAAPVVFDRQRTLRKVHALVAEAANKGAQLVLFPEAFVSGYPRGLDFGAVVGSRTESGRDDFCRYWESSVDVPGPAVDELGRIALKHARAQIVRGKYDLDVVGHYARPDIFGLSVDERPKTLVTTQSAPIIGSEVASAPSDARSRSARRRAYRGAVSGEIVS